MDKHRILLVDDSPNELRILMEVLKHKYAIVVATSGEQAVNMVKEDKQIELVMLDVNMPLKNGYDTCKEILAISPELPVVFVSANDSTDEILKGFDVGGVDYLTKPIDTNVVARKVDVIVHERELLQQLQDEHKNTSDMVMSVIQSAGHLGTVLGFLRAGLKIKTHEGLLSALFDVFDGLNMDVCVQLRTPVNVINKATRGMLTPLEEDLLSRAGRMQARFLEKGNRYIVNFESISVIVKNMPEDDIVKGDLRDNLMMILEDTDALNTKLGASASPAASSSPVKPDSAQTSDGAASADAKQNLAASTSPELRERLLDVASTLDMLSKQYQTNKSSIVNIIEDMNIEFEQAFFKLGLLEQQEDELTSIVAGKTEQFNQSTEQSEEMKEAIESIQEQLKQIVNSL
ncbi:PleD family two-component system response regulator [Glaciecola siphonariae]|uniref:PleD family two-component system response regulator n=1 Tax=Glaciecola siphonariae TaxID=521012 RepID=A0ABV9M1P9_9ALTE